MKKTVSVIALSNIRYNKSRSLLTCIAITMASFLLMVIGISGSGMIRYQQTNAGTLHGTWHAACIRMDRDMMEQITHNVQLEETGVSTNVAYLDSDKADGVLNWSDDGAMKISGSELLEGTMPQAEHEIVIAKELAGLLGSSGEIGATVSVPYRYSMEAPAVTEDFIISGHLEATEEDISSGSYLMYISEAFLKRMEEKEEQVFSAYLIFADMDTLGQKGIEKLAAEAAAAAGIPEENLVINKVYLMFATDPGNEIILTCIIIALFVIVFSIFVIYSIFYVGMVNKIREYGSLRALGITRRQLKGVILREGMFLSCIGVPAGMLLGELVAVIGFNLIIYNTAQDIQKVSMFNLPITLLVAALSFAAVYLSTLRPMKMAASVSPVEAMRYNGDAKERKTKKKTSRPVKEEMNLFRLTVSNMKKNHKQTAITIVSLSFSAILLVVIASVLSSMDPAIAARKVVRKGDFKIEYNYDLNDKAYPENNLNSLLAAGNMEDVLMPQIKSIDGVTNVVPDRKVMAKIQHEAWEETGYNGVLSGVSREDYEKAADILVYGEVNYDKAVSDIEVISTQANYLASDGIEIGDKLTLELYDGEQMHPLEVTVQAAVDDMYEGDFFIAQEILDQYLTETSSVSGCYIYADSKSRAAVSEQLQTLCDTDDRLLLESYDELVSTYKTGNNTLTYPLYALLGVISFIGFINLANTLITSVVTRKRELGILQAIGLSDRQLASMLKTEGLVFTIGTLVIALTFGNLLGYLTYLASKGLGITMQGAYQFPLIPIIILSVVLIGMQLFLSVVIGKNIQKDTLTERIRHEG